MKEQAIFVIVLGKITNELACIDCLIDVFLSLKI